MMKKSVILALLSLNTSCLTFAADLDEISSSPATTPRKSVGFRPSSSNEVVPKKVVIQGSHDDLRGFVRDPKDLPVSPKGRILASPKQIAAKWNTHIEPQILIIPSRGSTSSSRTKRKHVSHSDDERGYFSDGGVKGASKHQPRPLSTEDKRQLLTKKETHRKLPVPPLALNQAKKRDDSALRRRQDEGSEVLSLRKSHIQSPRALEEQAKRIECNPQPIINEKSLDHGIFFDPQTEQYYVVKERTDDELKAMKRKLVKKFKNNSNKILVEPFPRGISDRDYEFKVSIRGDASVNLPCVESENGPTIGIIEAIINHYHFAKYRDFYVINTVYFDYISQRHMNLRAQIRSDLFNEGLKYPLTIEAKGSSLSSEIYIIQDGMNKRDPNPEASPVREYRYMISLIKEGKEDYLCAVFTSPYGSLTVMNEDEYGERIPKTEETRERSHSMAAPSSQEVKSKGRRKSEPRRTASTKASSSSQEVKSKGRRKSQARDTASTKASSSSQEVKSRERRKSKAKDTASTKASSSSQTEKSKEKRKSHRKQATSSKPQ